MSIDRARHRPGRRAALHCGRAELAGDVAVHDPVEHLIVACNEIDSTFRPRGMAFVNDRLKTCQFAQIAETVPIRYFTASMECARTLRYDRREYSTRLHDLATLF
jgi:hypothetical protein